MSTSITLEEAKAKLGELIAQLQPGDEIVITQDSRPIAEVRPVAEPGTPVFGRGKDLLLKEIDDDEHLQDFADDMQ